MCLSQGCEIQNAKIGGRIFSSARIYLENGATPCAIVDTVDCVMHVVLRSDTLISLSLRLCISVCLSVCHSFSRFHTQIHKLGFALNFGMFPIP